MKGYIDVNELNECWNNQHQKILHQYLIHEQK
jgi:hypothetical protein